MRQFINGNDSDYADLERRATRACIPFAEQELPPGAFPNKTRIGFEINPGDGSALLLIDRGVRYSGPSPIVRIWLRDGQLKFVNFPDLVAWIKEDLAKCYVEESEKQQSDIEYSSISAAIEGKPA